MPTKPRTRRAPHAAPPEPSLTHLQFDAWKGDPDFMLSLARGLLVLRTIVEASAPKTVAEIAKRTGLDRAAARRCAHTLRELDYLAQDEWGFTAGPRMIALTSAFELSYPLSVGCRPVLAALYQKVHQNVSLGVYDEGGYVYTVRSEIEGRWALQLNLGERVPAYCSAMGRVLLAHKPPAAVENYLKRTPLKPITRHTVTSEAGLMQLLAEAREQGYAVSDRELDPALLSVAVPVRNQRGHVVAAINVGGNTADIGFNQIRREILPAMLTSAAALSSLIP